MPSIVEQSSYKGMLSGRFKLSTFCVPGFRVSWLSRSLSATKDSLSPLPPEKICEIYRIAQTHVFGRELIKAVLTIWPVQTIC
jgi:hypothetical protein